MMTSELQVGQKYTVAYRPRYGADPIHTLGGTFVGMHGEGEKREHIGLEFQGKTRWLFCGLIADIKRGHKPSKAAIAAGVAGDSGAQNRRSKPVAARTRKPAARKTATRKTATRTRKPVARKTATRKRTVASSRTQTRSTARVNGNGNGNGSRGDREVLRDRVIDNLQEGLQAAKRGDWNQVTRNCDNARRAARKHPSYK